MHTAAQAAVEPVLSPKCLANHAVQQEIPPQRPKLFFPVIHDSPDPTASESGHDPIQFLRFHGLHSPKPAGQNLSVTAVGTEAEVILIQAIGLSHIGRLLTDPQMRGTGMGIGYSLVFAGRLDEIEHGLKLTDITHVTVNVNQVFF